jgi:hypothetical protein
MGTLVAVVMAPSWLTCELLVFGSFEAEKSQVTIEYILLAIVRFSPGDKIAKNTITFASDNWSQFFYELGFFSFG